MSKLTVLTLTAIALAAAACVRSHAAAVAPEREFAMEPRGASESADVRYELTHDPGAACWRVRMTATGLDAESRDLRLILEDWGEWTEVDSYYLRELESKPPWTPDPESSSRFAIEVPPKWDGTFEASYVLALARSGSHAQQAKALLPRCDADDAAGFSINTLAELAQSGAPVAGTRRIRFVAPADSTIATGWGGVSTGRQEVRLAHPIDNVPILFGRMSGFATSEVGATRFEVAQFGAARDVAGEALHVARALVPLYGQTSGRPYEDVVRIFLTPLTSGGTSTDHGCVVSYTAGDFEAGPSLDFVRLAAHELFHIWLGGIIAPPEDESLVWFHEGFTEYLAMWHAVAAGLAEPDWFAERALSLEAEARSSQAFGRVAFADPSVRWRDGNGPNETLGYKGGATLALLADVELRRAGRAGLMELVAELLRAGGPLSLAAIHDRMEALGLAEFYDRYVASPTPLPAIGAALLELGFEAADSEASLTYVGIQVGDGDTSREIVAIDPEGPAARAGFEVGDLIVSCSPGRPNPPRIRDSVATPYRFGLNSIASGAAAATIEVERRGKPLSLSVAPRLIAGGVRTSYRGGRPAVERFFRSEPNGAVTR